MKKLSLCALLVILIKMAAGQTVPLQDQAKIDEIEGLLNTKDYLEAIKSLNSFIPKYPNIGQLYFMRGLSRLNLNDVMNAQMDFKLAKSWGYRVEEKFIDLQTSKEYLAKALYENLKLEVKPDPARQFRPAILPADTVQGGLRAERSCFDVNYYNLTVKVIPESKSIEGSNEIFFKTKSAARTIQIDLFENFNVTDIVWNGKNPGFKRKYGALFIDLGEEIPAGESHKLVISYSGSPRIAPKPPWNGGFVWEEVKNRHYIGVACEHLGASSWWPCKDHLSDKPDSMTIHLQVPEGYAGISNGNLVSEKKLDNGYHDYEWFVSYPINTYNVTLYVGDFVNFNEKYAGISRDYQIDYYVLPQNLDKARKYYSKTGDILQVFEKLFGEYPFASDGVAMVESPFEGMEHQGAIAIGGNYGKGEKREYWTDEYDYLLIHETGHEWWGNAVAIGDMADAWINEGFTTYSECLFAEEKSGYADYVSQAATNQKYILNLWPITGTRNVNENTFIGSDIYHKGSAMLNNLRCIINNDTLFSRIIREYYQRYKYRITTTNDFVNLVHEITRMDYSDLFRIFLYETEPPVLACQYNIDSRNRLTFTYSWSNAGSNFSMPFCISVNGKEYIRLVGTSTPQTFTREKVKSFAPVNEHNYRKELVPANSFTYYWTSWKL